MIPTQNKIEKIIHFEEDINTNHISIISYKNGLVVGDFGAKLNVTPKLLLFLILNLFLKIMDFPKQICSFVCFVSLFWQKFYKKLENDWCIIWSVELKWIPAILLHGDANTILMLSTDGIVDRLHEEKSIGIINSITSLQR